MGYRGEVMLSFKKRNKINIDDITTIFEGFVSDDMYAEILKRAEKINEEHNYKYYEVGDRGAQIIILPYPKVDLIESDELSDSERGAGGHGSSGK